MSNAANQGVPGNSKKSLLNKETVERFAQNMAQEIVQSLQMEIEDFWDFRRGQESMANELASNVIGMALREVCKVERNEALQKSSKDVPKNYPPLSQSGLPILGSLDYPDAPPSTPLLPELEKSRQSFNRKLKGGLAKEFLPSPPPPTPKEDEPGAFDPKVELIEHLMHSLSTDQSQKDSKNNGKIVAFAEALSGDIVKCAGKQIADRCSMEPLANQMAQVIIKSSLEEVKIDV